MEKERICWQRKRISKELTLLLDEVVSNVLVLGWCNCDRPVRSEPEGRECVYPCNKGVPKDMALSVVWSSKSVVLDRKVLCHKCHSNSQDNCVRNWCLPVKVGGCIGLKRKSTGLERDLFFVKKVGHKHTYMKSSGHKKWIEVLRQLYVCICLDLWGSRYGERQKLSANSRIPVCIWDTICQYVQVTVFSFSRAFWPIIRSAPSGSASCGGVLSSFL